MVSSNVLHHKTDQTFPIFRVQCWKTREGLVQDYVYIKRNLYTHSEQATSDITPVVFIPSQNTFSCSYSLNVVCFNATY